MIKYKKYEIWREKNNFTPCTFFLPRCPYQACNYLFYGQSSFIFVTNSTTELVFDSVINNLSLLAKINPNRRKCLIKSQPIHISTIETKCHRIRTRQL